MNKKIVAALNSLRPNAIWILRGIEYSGIDWKDPIQAKPTQEEIDTEIARLQAEYEAKEYQRQREPNYPSVKEQLDMLWHAIDSGTLNKSSDFYKTLKSVKDQYPKT
jgi:hypothetical protein